MKVRVPPRIYLIVLIAVAGAWLLSAEESTRIVHKGDTLYSIAKQNGVSLEELKQANGITDPSKVRMGQKLIIPGKKNQTTSTSDTPASKPNTDSESGPYVVKTGDTLYSIAKNNGIELKQLLNDNKLTRESILRPGQQLALRGKTEKQITVKTDVPVANATPNASPAPINASDLSGDVTTGTSFQKTAYTQGTNLNWPSPGERFTLNGKLPGILIKAQKGETVRSVNTGKVVYSGPHSTFGHIVFVQSPDGFIYIYGGNESSPLKTGEIVHTGDIIGTVGLTPGIQEPQVYFSIWKDGSYINPANVLRS